MGKFERYLSIWVGLSIALGLLSGTAFPEFFQLLANFEYAGINFIIAALIWAMIYPMMVNVDFGTIRNFWRAPKGICLTVFVNWLIKPFTMALLAIFFFQHVFIGFVEPHLAKEYIAGMILLGVAPCTAMVFVWSHLVNGNSTYTLLQVSINDIIMIFAFAPIATVLLGLTDIVVPWTTLLVSIILYVVFPVLAGYITRKKFLSKYGYKRIISLNNTIKPFSILGLLATVTLLFAFQATTIIDNPLAIILIAIPLLIQTYGIFAITYLGGFLWRIPFQIAAPAALIGTSNFFELAVAVAISVFGVQSGAALATIVGVLVEVPVMLSLVYFANHTKQFFPTPSTEL
ncbi:ACR3 family arsenite efflux transporter [SAR202 cluster bacterium AC-409-J13_OGT_754m]|nr:ACR3 family arsenite efflux transporter [SAR202 cluster bacterium AC-409-J13_OGT_754m]